MTRTFPAHEHRHELHGLTVVVETDGPELWVGRCDDVVAEGVAKRSGASHPAASGPSTSWPARSA